MPELKATFDAEHKNLHWVALVITGDPQLAEKTIVDASGLRGTNGGVFHDWLARWAHSATARVAARSVRELIFTSAQQYCNWTCEHTDHELLSDDQVRTLRQLDPQQIITNLDPLARAVLLLRGIQRASISDCSMLLDVPRRSVLGAYCHALNWIHECKPQGGNNAGSTAMSCDISEVQK